MGISENASRLADSLRKEGILNKYFFLREGEAGGATRVVCSNGFGSCRVVVGAEAAGLVVRDEDGELVFCQLCADCQHLVIEVRRMLTKEEKELMKFLRIFYSPAEAESHILGIKEAMERRAARHEKADQASQPAKSAPTDQPRQRPLGPDDYVVRQADFSELAARFERALTGQEEFEFPPARADGTCCLDHAFCGKTAEGWLIEGQGLCARLKTAFLKSKVEVLQKYKVEGPIPWVYRTAEQAAEAKQVRDAKRAERRAAKQKEFENFLELFRGAAAGRCALPPVIGEGQLLMALVADRDSAVNCHEVRGRVARAAFFEAGERDPGTGRKKFAWYYIVVAGEGEAFEEAARQAATARCLEWRSKPRRNGDEEDEATDRRRSYEELSPEERAEADRRRGQAANRHRAHKAELAARESQNRKEFWEKNIAHQGDGGGKGKKKGGGARA